MEKRAGAFPPGSRLQEARKAAGLTQKDLETRANVAQSTISEYETGKTRDMEASSLARLAFHVGTSVEHLVLGTGERVVDKKFVRPFSDAAAALAELYDGLDENLKESLFAKLQAQIQAVSAGVRPMRNRSAPAASPMPAQAPARRKRRDTDLARS